MSGVAGIVDLQAQRVPSREALRKMSAAIAHRGPDGEATFECPGVALALRRLEIIREKDAEPRIAVGEDRPVVFLDGAIYNAAELAEEFNGNTGPAADLIARLWKKHGEATLLKLRGQFALAIWDPRNRRLTLARDRFGVCPMHWTQQGDWLLFGSEIKALLASKMVDTRPDVRGINHAFTFFGVPGPITCFEGIRSLPPGHLLEIRLGPTSGDGIAERSYWQMDFPDRGEERTADESQLVDEYDAVMRRALQRRLRADDPVVAYSSGGLDSSMLVSMIGQLDRPPRTYTFRIEHPHLKESEEANTLAQHLGSQTTVVDLSGEKLLGTFTDLVKAAESPVIDVSAASLFRLADAVHQGGHKVVITGEGADEWQAGYPWFRIQQRLSRLGFVPGFPRLGFGGYTKVVHSLRFPWSLGRRYFNAAGGDNAWLLAYVLMSAWKLKLFSADLRRELADHVPLADLGLDLPRMRRWHPLNRSVHLGARVHLAGLHLAARGDRSAMHSSVQTRYPFLDEELFDFLAPLHPQWKLRGRVDKYLQRRLADRWLPETFAQGRKSLLHAPLDAFHLAAPPEELLSDKALRKTGYFDPVAVRTWRTKSRHMRHGFRRLFVEMCLVGVISTQLWYHQYFDSASADG